jgi:iron(III) transport system substrate-binding protein
VNDCTIKAVRKRFNFFFSIGLGSSALLLTDPGITLAGELRPWQVEWEKTVEAAKKEGQVNIFFRHDGPLKVFQEEYPEIKIISVTGRGSQLTQRLLAERRAGKYLADVLSSGTGTNEAVHSAKGLDPIKDVLLLPEVVDESNWWGGKHRYMEPDGKYIFAYLIKPATSQLQYNTNLVDPKEFHSQWDLLKPKWKGKIVSLHPADTGLQATIQRFYYQPDLGPKFMRGLFGDRDITFSKDHRQMTDWLAQGRFAICLGCRDVAKARALGLPVNEFDSTGWKEAPSLASAGGNLSLVNRAPHPNAAKVFVNWYLSRNGQMAVQRFWDPDQRTNSRRIDIPKDIVAPNQKLVEGKEYLDLEGKDIEPARKLIKEILTLR